MKKLESLHEEIESFSKDIENIRKNQSENTKTKIKGCGWAQQQNERKGVKKFSELEGETIEIILIVLIGRK